MVDTGVAAGEDDFIDVTGADDTGDDVATGAFVGLAELTTAKGDSDDQGALVGAAVTSPFWIHWPTKTSLPRAAGSQVELYIVFDTERVEPEQAEPG